MNKNEKEMYDLPFQSNQFNLKIERVGKKRNCGLLLLI